MRRQAEQFTPTNEHESKGRAASHFTPKEEAILEDAAEAISAPLTVQTTPHGPHFRGTRWVLRLLALILLIMFASQWYGTAHELLNAWPPLSYLFIGITGALLLVMLKLGVKYRSRSRAFAQLIDAKQLPNPQWEQQLTQQLAHSQHHVQWQQTQAQLPDYLSADERAEQLEQRVVAPMDEAALSLVHKRSAEIGLGVAISPWSALDMLITLYKLNQMAKALCLHYGAPGLWWQRYKVMMAVLTTIGTSGVSQWTIDEIMGQWLSQGVVSSVSTRLSQGVLVATLALRVGLLMQQSLSPAKGAPKMNLAASVKLVLANLIKGAKR